MLLQISLDVERIYKVGTINFTSPCSLVNRQFKKSLLTTQSNFNSDWCEKTSPISLLTELFTLPDYVCPFERAKRVLAVENSAESHVERGKIHLV
jgi:hypothetical protein